ncbi:MAG: glutamate racemase [Rickettsiales bacterium]|jgi:glutamate racemase|nr:glutamate racemase [Rickettsiales bacterium]
MNIGIFDSGLGGLIIAKSLIDAFPGYGFAYLGDTLHVPYGPRSIATIYEFTRACVDRLFRTKDCKLVVIACNTASIAALRRLQREYLPASFPGRRILGVVIPTLEEVIRRGHSRIGLLATAGTVASGVYGEELKKLDGAIELFGVEAPLLVPLVENCGDRFAHPIIESYLETFRGKDIDALILGCTHYPHYKDMIRGLMPGVDVISQDEIIPASLADYLSRHPEIERGLSKDGNRSFAVTDITDSYRAQAERLFGGEIEIERVEI